jgi:CheY-like chemotaxis protein
LSHLLVVDDDEQFRGYVVAMLRKRGYTVTEASNGRRALRILETTRVDIIITDIVMPDMEGLEAIRHFRVMAPDSKIVAMSGGGSGDVDYLHFAAEFGAVATLNKPFTPSEIVDIVSRLETEKA